MAVEQQHLTSVPASCLEPTHDDENPARPACYQWVLSHKPGWAHRRLVRLTDDAHGWCQARGIAYELRWQHQAVVDDGMVIIIFGSQEHLMLWRLTWP